MRLELEQNQAHPGYAGNAADTAVENRAAEAANHLREGIRAAQSGNRAAARTSLLRAAELDPQSESAWMWLSSISEYPEELLAFLTNVLEINPHNARALEWSAATKSLLAKNLVQRGIDAAESSQNDLAAQLFHQALEYDERNTMAWLWLASLCDSTEGKLSYLEKVLEFEPDNETAKAGYHAAKNSIREGLLAEARMAAVGGDSKSANDLLDAVIAEEPDAEDAWVLKSHIAVGFEEKIAAFRRVLEINPTNNVARAGLESLTAIMDAVGAAAVQPENIEASPDEAEAAAEPEAESFAEPEPVEESVEAEMTADRAWEVAAEPSKSETEPAEAFYGPVEEQAIEAEAASPFDSLAEEPVVDLNGTMLMTTSDFGFDLDELVEVTEGTAAEFTSGVPEASFAETVQDEAAATAETTDLEEPAAFEDPAPVTPDAELTAEAPSFAYEPEEITYELASETPDRDVEGVSVQMETAAEAFVEPEIAEEPAECPSHDYESEATGQFTDDAISAPGGNPFDAPAFRNDFPAYDTVISVSPEAFIPEEDDAGPVPAASNGMFEGTLFNIPFDATRYAGTIPMPESGLEPLLPEAVTGYETRVVASDDELPQPPPAASACPFCGTENDVQAIACNSCLAVLTLADLELVLANHHADKDVLRSAVNRLEAERSARQLSEAELTTLGIGHLNLRDLQEGYDRLHEAAQLNPNNVVLSGQANALLIRLGEIKEQAEAHDAMVKGKTILVVDDSPTVRKLIAGKLEKSGHEVFCCGDGVEAMDRLSTVKPDLILLDITMPRMDGYQVCKLIRADAATKDTPVVMISGKDGFFDKVRGRMAGCSGYITKPFGPETLMKAVESYLSPEA